MCRERDRGRFGYIAQGVPTYLSWAQQTSQILRVVHERLRYESRANAPPTPTHMILKQLLLREYRGFSETPVEFHPRLTVFVGTNGAGKSSILDALNILLDQYSARLLGTRQSAKRLGVTDARNNAPDTRIRLVVEDEGREVAWTLHKAGKKQRVLRPTTSELSTLNEFVKAIIERTPFDDEFLRDVTLPIFYDQRRALAEVPQRKRAAAKHSAIDAFTESRAKGGLDFRGFVYWFEERETEELRKQRRDRSYEDSQLATVRRAIAEATDLTDLSYRPIPPRGLMVRKLDIELRVDQLSTGERAFLAVAGDLARRLAMLGGDAGDAHLKRAIVLIDEVELHLHPSWQRSILPWLLRAFPNCQFIVTTHSPQVVGAVEAEHIRVLNFHPEGNTISRVSASKGRDSNYLLLSVFESIERNRDSKRLLERFENALAHNQFGKADATLRDLENEIEGGAPEMSIAQARLQRRQRMAP